MGNPVPPISFHDSKAKELEALSLQSPIMIQKQKNWKPCPSNLLLWLKSKKIGNLVPQISFSIANPVFFAVYTIEC